MATLIKVAALVAFSIVTKSGVIHGDPDNSDEKAQYPMVPEDRVDELLDAGKIALLKKDAESDSESVDEEGTGDPDAESDFAMTHIAGGRFRISGPGVPPDTVVKGKAAAEAMISDLRAAAVSTADDYGAPV